MIQAHRAYNDPLESGQHPHCWSAESFSGKIGISMPNAASSQLTVPSLLAAPSPLEVPPEHLQPVYLRLQPVCLSPDIPMPCRNQQLTGRAV